MALAACVAALIAAPAADAAGGKKEGTPSDPQAKHFVKKISVDRMTAHQAELQAIADANDGTRTTVNELDTIGSGYQASVDYVVETLEAAGYDAQIDMFNFPFWQEATPTLLQLNGNAEPYVRGHQARRRLAGRRLHHDGLLGGHQPPGRADRPDRRGRPARGRLDERLPAGGLRRGAGSHGQDRADPARRVRLRRQVGARRGERRRRRDPLQRGQHRRAAEPDLGRQPDRHGDRRGHHLLRGRQRAAPGLPGRREPDGRLRRRHGGLRPLPAPGAGRTRPTAIRTTSSWSAAISTPCRRARASTTTAPASRCSSRWPRSSPSSATTGSCSTRSASCSSAPRRTG